MKQLISKPQMYVLYEGGAFGNKLKTWTGLENFCNSGFAGEVSVRTAVAGGGKTKYRVKSAEVAALAAEWGMSSQMCFNESAPDEHLAMQGEIYRSPYGLYLRWNDTPNLKFREAMLLAEHSYGLQATTLLQQHLTPSSLADLLAILDAHEDHVVEFSAYRMPLGDIPGRNTIVWEVRLY